MKGLFQVNVMVEHPNKLPESKTFYSSRKEEWKDDFQRNFGYWPTDGNLLIVVEFDEEGYGKEVKW